MNNSIIVVNAEDINKMICKYIKFWHEKYENLDNRNILSDYNTEIKTIGEYRDDIKDVVSELVLVNTEMWHEQDKIRSDDPDKLLNAIKNISPLNQHRNDLIEEIDEIVCHYVKEDVG